jgi:hypothetical protein
MSRSTLPTSSERGETADGAIAAPLFPTETEIYLLPDGCVVVADLPAELAAAFAQLGNVEACAVAPAVESPAPQP